MLHMCSYARHMFDPLDTSTLEPARKAIGFSRAELAEAANVSATTILRIEKGEVDPMLAATWAPIARVVADRVRTMRRAGRVSA